MRGLAYTDDRPRVHDPEENKPLVPYTPSATGGELPRSPASVVMLATGGAHMASGEGDGEREGVRVRVHVRVREGEGVRVRVCVRVGVREGVGIDRLAGRHGSATPPVKKDGGTAV